MTHLTENITYEKYDPVSHTYNSLKCVTCNTSDQIYLARDKFDRKLPCCKNYSTELFIVVTYLTKYMTCEKSDRISHTYISPKMFPFIKILFTGVQAIEILMYDKLVWVKNSKSAKRILHLCPNVKNSVEFITPAWGIRSVRNTVQHGSVAQLLKTWLIDWLLLAHGGARFYFQINPNDLSDQYYISLLL